MELARDWRGGSEDAPDDVALALEDLPLPLGGEARRPSLRGAVARAADFTAALVLLVLASPLIVAGALLVLVTGGRPVFFGHVRMGQGGRLFRCWKLRTMRSDAEERLAADADLHRRYLENGFKLPSGQDPRVLPVGRWLRRLYLDELPQLWNVIRGDMSLVGPRPVVPRELRLFGRHAAALLGRRPGVFGEWTSRGRRRPPYPERVRVEMEYVNDPSLGRTLRILARSVGAVLVGQGEEG